jgi:hypothetical protein
MRGNIIGVSAVCLGLFATGCGGGGNEQTPAEVATGFVAAWNAHDAQAVCRYYTDQEQALYAQHSGEFGESGPKTCARFIDGEFATDPGGRWKPLPSQTTLHGETAIGSAASVNRRGLIDAIPMVKEGDSWRVGGVILISHP